MTITVEIPTDIEKQIQKNISQGDTETARQLLLNALAPTVEASIADSATPSELSYDEFKELADKLVDTFMGYVDPDCPPLSDYAVSREGIYQDHL